MQILCETLYGSENFESFFSTLFVDTVLVLWFREYRFGFNSLSSVPGVPTPHRNGSINLEKNRSPVLGRRRRGLGWREGGVVSLHRVI